MKTVLPADQRKTRKFKSADFYSKSNDTYYLMPFRFGVINSTLELLSNDYGDYLVVPRGTAEKVILRKLEKEENIDLYFDLLSHNMISEHRVPPLMEVLETRYQTKKSFLDNFTALHIFVISLRCEHTCHYCQVSRVTQNRETYDMSIKHIDQGIELMMRTPNPHVTMEFQGGEALLAFDRIQYGVLKAKEAAKSNHKKITFVICTNLAPLEDDMLPFILEHDILISTSLDGPEFIHNKNRPRPGKDSHQKTLEGIAKCRTYLGEEKVSALTTTTTLSLDHVEEIIDEYLRLDFKNIFLRPISPYGFARFNAKKNQYETDRFLEFYKKGLQKIIEINKNGHFFREDYASIILKKILTPFPVGYVDLQSPAGMLNNVVVFNYNGKIYATDEARMLAETGDDTFLLGELGKNTYEEIFYGEKALEFSEYWANESLTGCSDCVFQSYCGADPVHHYATQGDPYGHRPTSSFCQKNMEIIRYLFEMMHTQPETERIFRSWITGFNQS